MKNKILLAISLVSLLQVSCKKNGATEDKNKSLSRLSQPQFSTMSMLTGDFCSLVSSEQELDFGLDRNPESNVYTFSQAQLNAGLSNFHNYFKFDSSGVVVDLDSSRQSLSTGDLQQLFSVIQGDSIVDYNADSNYAALRMTFGLEGRKIIIIYEPIVLKPTGIMKEYSIVSTNKFFKVDEYNNFMAIPVSDFNTFTNNLRGSTSNIRITHPNNPSDYSFINNMDATGDIRSNVMSFQEIVKMYCDNNQETYSSERIKFSIVANQNATLTSNYRMHVVVSYRLGLSTPALNTFKNYAADYGSMCPLNCGIVFTNHYK